jgi:hypothetical protein
VAKPAKPATDITEYKRGDWRWRFLEMLAKSSCVSTACVAAGISRDIAYNHRGRFPNFRRKWDDALEVATEVLEVEARSRALDRTDNHSAMLLQFLLKAHKPAKYREPKTADAKAVAADPSSLEPAAPAVVFYIPDNGRASNVKSDHQAPAGSTGNSSE